jgi:hypothetical protein
MIALKPVPLMGTANAVSLSALIGLLAVNFATRGNGQADGGSPPSAVDGSQGQLCCGENEIVIEQLCCGARENADPDGLAQLSCSVKFGSPSKSLNPKRLVFPDWGLNDNDKPVRGVPERPVFVSVIVCMVGADPTCCAGKVIEAGASIIGCVQLVVFPNPKHTSPMSPARFPPGQEFVVTPYPLVPSRTAPATELTKVTGEGFEKPAGAPIWPTFNPLGAMICRMTELPLIWPLTEAVVKQG